MKCKYCEKDILNKKSLFCSRSCSTTYNNLAKKTGKAKTGKTMTTCKGCSSEKERDSRLYCKSCLSKKIKYLDNPTKGELTEAYTEKNHRSSAYGYIRWHAREVIAKNWDKKCSNCGYNKHVELAHIKSISSFTDEANLNTINEPTNLVFLCPNCHWEFDNGILDKLVSREGIEPPLEE